ncbi:hypothetical protein SAY86_000840 [Trapa natans]|uniref:Sialate O-acetylesterase domain-containing protein n=1 Tax=Trapa natans TaxID=22666 RepID=A0AAN7RFZ4_TRANT|nr:hypothetical protein SAY86_000840 [Trapa natans]
MVPLSSLHLLLLPIFLLQLWSSMNQQLALPPAEKAIFILAGQSNMAGRGGVINDTSTGMATWDGIVPPECRPNRSIIRLAANLTWVEAREPLHSDIDAKKTNGVGPGMPFAHAVLGAARPGFGAIGLVPCAVGGTKIKEWERGTVLYDQLTRRAQAAMRGGGRLRAVLWYQGESDTLEREDAELYQWRLERFFLDLTADLQIPGLPIFQVALASKVGPYTEKVREAQLGLCQPNVRTVDATGLPLEPGGLHLTTPAQVWLGKMLAQAFLNSIPSPAFISSPATRTAPPSICSFASLALGLARMHITI